MNDTVKDVRKLSNNVEAKEVLEHILTICKIYECSTDKLGRIHQYAEHKLSELKDSKKRKGVKKNVSND